MNLAPFTRETIRTIRLNAGKVHPVQLAKDCGISLAFLERIAKDHGIDLRLASERIVDPVARAEPFDSRVFRARVRKPNPRTEYINATLFAADVAAIDALAMHLGIKRSRVVSRVVENARARGLLEELARLPAPAPEPTGNLDGEE